MSDDAGDVKELYTYEEGKNKSKENATTTDNTEKPEFVKHRIFINHVDQFNPRHFAAFITDQIYGALGQGGGGEFGEEMGEEQPGEEETARPTKLLGPVFKYEVIGTVKIDFHKKSEDVQRVLVESDTKTFEEEILNCGFVIYDITQDEREIPKALNTLTIMVNEIERIAEIGPKTFKDYPDVRVFILISTCMTWATSKPIDRDDPDTPFTEADYKKRRPHPNYEQHIACERTVVLTGRKYKDKLKTFVVCCGLVYGAEEEDLTFLFKLAWKNEKYLPVFLPGTNFIPLIHVKDLAQVIHGICENLPRKQFVLAVEQTPCRLKQIVKMLAKVMGRGQTREVSQQEAFLYSDITQKDFERCTVNLPMEPAYIVDDLDIQWQTELNLVENMAKIVAQFRIARGLRPYRIVLHGPPGVGKTTLAKKLCEYYGCHYISVKTMIEETIENLRENIDVATEKLRTKGEVEVKKKPIDEDDEDEEVEEEEVEVDETDLIDEWKEQLRDIEAVLEESENGKLPDEYVIRLLKSLITSNICQNQGYVLDGYPKTTQQAQELFGQAAEAGGEEAGGEEEEETTGIVGNATRKLLPDCVISLKATDEYLCKRIMALPEHEVQGTHYTEEGMLRRLAEFRALNTEDDTVLNFFNENEIHPIIIDAMVEDPEEIFNKAKVEIGPYIGFTITPEEEEELLRLERERLRLLEEEQRLQKSLLEQQALDLHRLKMEEWTHALEKLQMEEEKMLAVQSEPLRNYLMRYVFPTLAKGLLNVVSIKPSDPVDYLAEFLFRENPEGCMFDPSYTRDGEQLMSDLKESVEKILNEILDKNEM